MPLVMGRVGFWLQLGLLPGALSTVLVEPYGPDALRVRVSAGGAPISRRPSALLAETLPATALPAEPAVAATPGRQGVTNGNLRMEPVPNGGRRFVRVSDGAVLLTERAVGFGPPLPAFALGSVSASFDVAGQQLYGLGMQRQTCYESGGRQTPVLGAVFSPGEALSFDLAAGEGGAANTLPWLTSGPDAAASQSSFGFWLNNPVEDPQNPTRAFFLW